MKKIYSFTIWNEVEKDSVKTYVPQKFFLRKPSRSMIDDAEMFYSIEFNNFIKMGLLTKSQLATKFADEVDSFSNKDRERYLTNYTNLLELETKLQSKTIKNMEERTPEEKVEVENLVDQIIKLQEELQIIENSQQGLFEHTADVKARNRLILWWTFALSFYEDGKPFFGEGDFNKKIQRYDEYFDSDDKTNLSIARKLIYLVSFWYSGRAEDEKTFDDLAKFIGVNVNPQDIKDKEKAEEPKPEPEVKAS